MQNNLKTVLATRRDFFRPDGVPIAMRTIHGDTTPQHDGDLTDTPHAHDFSELVIITGGSGHQWIDGEIHSVSAGDIFLIQGNSKHYFIERNRIDMYNIMFDDQFLKEHLRSLRSLPGFNAFFLFEPSYRRKHKFNSHLHISPDELAPLSTILHRMVCAAHGSRPGFDIELLANVLEIFVFISRAYSTMKTPQAVQLRRLGELISRLEKDYSEEWSIARISRLTMMAPSTLLPIFKSITGRSPIDYLLHVRLNQAAWRLTQSNDSVSQIAADCGFTDSNYFSRQFRKVYHCTPRQYRDA
ncbi:MAG: helix-turn-helix domain-containing protein [Victivallaceae bacterium]|nr:helix-turn-helix domain-containing protein [Victivallaceae bacterium]